MHDSTEQPSAPILPTDRGRERRAAPRLTCELDAQLVFEGERYPATIYDLSTTGAKLWSAANPPLGAVLEVQLPLPDAEPVTCSALVRWASPDNSLGVEFDGATPAVRGSLARFVLDRLDPQERAARQWRTELGASTLEAPGHDRHWTLRWRLGDPKVAAGVLSDLVDRPYLFVPSAARDLEAGQVLWLALELPFTHVGIRVAAEAVWVHRGQNTANGPGASLRITQWTERDRRLVGLLQGALAAEAG